MSLLYMSGFEGAPKSREVIQPGVTYNATGRTGQCMVVPGAMQASIALPTEMTDLITGFALRTVGYDPGQAARVAFVSPDGIEFEIRLEPSGALVARRVSWEGPFGQAPAAYTLEQWFYVETRVKIHQTAGILQMWVNGIKLIDFVGDTMNTGDTTPGVNAIHFYGPSANWAGSLHVDDFYLLDLVDGTASQGRAFNAPLGMPRIEPLTVSASGPTNEWVGSDGDSVDNHLLVDEIPPSSTDYVESSTVGQRELYDFSTPALSGDILAVDVSAFAVSPDGGANPIKTVARSAAGTVQVGAGAIPPSGSTYRYITDGPRTKDPDGNNWTKTAVGDATYGVEVG